MKDNTANNKPLRDYKREAALRKKKVRRLLVDIDKKKAERFLERLSEREITLVSWMNSRIDEEMNA